MACFDCFYQILCFLFDFVFSFGWLGLMLNFEVVYVFLDCVVRMIVCIGHRLRSSDLCMYM